MPMIRVEMLPGRSDAQKQDLAAQLTKGFLDSCGGTPESVHVVIEEVAAQHWAVAGTLLSARKPG